MLAVGLDGTESFTLQPGVGQQAPQPCQRMLDDALPCRLERVVALEDPQAAVRLQHAAHALRACARACRPALPDDPAPACRRAHRRARASGSLSVRLAEPPAPRTAAHGARQRRAPPAPRGANARARRTAAAPAPQHSSSSGCATPTTSAGPWAAASSGPRKPARARPSRDSLLAAALSGTQRRARRAAIAAQRRVAAVQLCEQARDEARGVLRAGHAVVHPLAVALALDEARLGEDLQVARNARLTLIQRPGEIGNAQRSLRTQGQQPQPRGLARGAQPS